MILWSVLVSQSRMPLGPVMTSVFTVLVVTTVTTMAMARCDSGAILEEVRS